MYVRAISGHFNIGYDHLLFQRLQQMPLQKPLMYSSVVTSSYLKTHSFSKR